MWRVLAAVPLGMKIAGKLIQIKGNSVRLMGESRPFQQPGIEREPPHQRKFAGVVESIQGGLGQGSEKSSGFLRQIRQDLPHVAEHGSATGMAVLNVENWIVARLFDHFGEIELEHGIVLAIEHHEAHGVAADFLHDLAQGHELPGTLRHLYLLATAHELDELDDLDVELRLAGVAVERPDS